MKNGHAALTRPGIGRLAVLGLLCVASPGCGADSRKPAGSVPHGQASAATSGDPSRVVASVLPTPDAPPSWSGDGCTQLACHGEIEAIRALDSDMMLEILELGVEHGDPDGCIVCHGGDPDASETEGAHRGAPTSLTGAGGPEDYYPDPASPWVNRHSCGQCHGDLVTAQWNSLMMTEAGKIQGTAWSFGLAKDYEHTWANYATENPEDPHARLGTADYRAYMEAKTAKHPQVFVDRHEALPPAPKPEPDGSLEVDPSETAFTYLRAECQRCHLGVKGRQRRGDFRGMGCGACHMPYGNEGKYEGKDRTMLGKTGVPLVHSIQATREAKVTVGDTTYTGIPVETCSTCHNRGKRIGVSYQGLMEKAWDSPYSEGGGGQPGLHTKHYLAMEQDVHFKIGMLCQDCHTSNDVHGDGFIAAANLGPIEIECSDCHGTPTAFPWELPLGYGDEDGRGDRATGPARGVSTTLPAHLERGAPADPRDGYLRSARGNPLPEVVRSGDRVLVHTAGGKVLDLEPLRAITERGGLSPEGATAMVHTPAHMETMECYACHSSWAPQCYGCHVEVDFSAGKRSFDWVAAGEKHRELLHQRDRSEEGYDTYVAGQVRELRSYMRWENPPLGVNGEGRVTPIVPGCQVSATVIGADGETIVRNKIFRTAAGTEGAGAEGQISLDMSPVQPHTTGKSRSCESCHGSAKAAGYGIGGTRRLDKATVVDLATADGKVIPAGAKTQIEALEGLQDWSAVVTRDGKQLQTVGHHFKDSGPLSAKQRQALDRENACVGCHQVIPSGSLAVSLLSHIGEVTGQTPVSGADHSGLLAKIVQISAWAQLLGGGLFLLAAGWGVRCWRRRRRA